jgi:hypothetical protein
MTSPSRRTPRSRWRQLALLAAAASLAAGAQALAPASAGAVIAEGVSEAECFLLSGDWDSSTGICSLDDGGGGGGGGAGWDPDSPFLPESEDDNDVTITDVSPGEWRGEREKEADWEYQKAVSELQAVKELKAKRREQRDENERQWAEEEEQLILDHQRRDAAEQQRKQRSGNSDRDRRPRKARRGRGKS